MRIAYLALEFPTEGNHDHGAGVSMAREACALSSLGHEVEIFVWSDRDEVFQFHGMRLERISRAFPFIARVLNKFTLHHFQQFLLCIFMSYKEWKAFRKRHKEVPYDIVMGAMSGGVTFFVSLLTRVPVVVRASQYQPYLTAYDGQWTLGTWLKDKYELWALKKADKVWAKSQYLADVLKAEAGIEATVIEPPLYIEADPDNSLLKEHGLDRFPYLVSWGPLGVTKGADIVTDTLNIVLPDYPKVRFVWVGTENKLEGIPAWEHIQTHLDSNIRQRVLWLGKIPKSQMIALLANARCVVTAARTGNLPNTVLESMLLGRPIIGTAGASLEQVVTNGVTGFIVPQEDPRALAQAIRHMMEMTDNEYQQMSLAAKNRMKSLSAIEGGLRLVHFLEATIVSFRKQRKKSA